MTANESALSTFLSNSKTAFVIPIYQRNYDWQDSHCSQLISDIIAVARDEDRPSHFIGSIVYMEDGIYTTSKVKEFTIIDGQQRVTTISLLYAALYHYAADHEMEEEAAEIKEHYLINRFSKERKEKLWQTDENSRVYLNVLYGKPEEGEPYSRIRENFKLFQEYIDSRATYDLISSGLGKLSFVEIKLERGRDDPQRIFESLNSTGLDLSQADLIRNYVLMGHARETQRELFDHYWQDIERLARQDEDQWNMVSEFVRSYLTFKNRKIPKKDRVYETFKERFTQRSYEEVKSLLSQLKTYAKYYGYLTNPDRESHPVIRRHLHDIQLLKIETSHPFLLEVYHDYAEKRIDAKTFIEVLELVQSFVFRRFVVNLPTNALNKIFMRLYEDVRHDQYLSSIEASLMRKKGTQRMPLDEEVKGALRERDVYNIQSKNRKYLFQRLENHQNKEPVALDELTIEHIFPQKPARGWKSDLTIDDYTSFQEKHLHQLGNLTYSGNNGSLGNKTFLEKRDMDKGGREQGYSFSRLWLNRSLQKQEEWTVRSFKRRHNQMIRRFLEVWPSPEIPEGLDLDERTELKITEIEDPTGFQVEYALLGADTRIEPRSVKEFYIEVLKWLFAKDRHPMMRPDVRSTILLEKDNANAREGEEIGFNYTVDAANSSWVKFKRLETVLSAYEMEDAVRVKFRE